MRLLTVGHGPQDRETLGALLAGAGGAAWTRRCRDDQET
jgi:hypothetical protein